MSLLFEVKSFHGDYGVQLFSPTYTFKKSAPSTRICIVDRNVCETIEGADYELIIPINASENCKTLDEVGRVIIEMKSNWVTRTDAVDVIGGGILQDIGTLATSIYMRGIKWNYFPTTLLGMVDSCIGGKSSINHGGYKNIIGNFYPPTSVFIHPRFCETLDEPKILEGLFEALKICIASGDPHLTKMLGLINNKCNVSSLNIPEIIRISLSAKKRFIEIDEFDQGPRLLLNFGHTFGHALEASTNFRIPHGIAVGIGMLMAFDAVPRLGIQAGEPLNQIHTASLIKKLLDTWPHKHAIVDWIDPNSAFKAFENDKKHTKESYNLILSKEQNGLAKVTVKRSKENRSAILNVFENVGSLI